MRKVLSGALSAGRGVGQGIGQAQGALGVAAVSGGAWIEFGAGWGTMIGGGFLLLGAWASR